jgi:hypothetical protein
VQELRGHDVVLADDDCEVGGAGNDGKVRVTWTRGRGCGGGMSSQSGYMSPRLTRRDQGMRCKMGTTTKP